MWSVFRGSLCPARPPRAARVNECLRACREAGARSAHPGGWGLRTAGPGAFPSFPSVCPCGEDLKGPARSPPLHPAPVSGRGAVGAAGGAAPRPAVPAVSSPRSRGVSGFQNVFVLKTIFLLSIPIVVASETLLRQRQRSGKGENRHREEDAGGRSRPGAGLLGGERFGRAGTGAGRSADPGPPPRPVPEASPRCPPVLPLGPSSGTRAGPPGAVRPRAALSPCVPPLWRCGRASCRGRGAGPARGSGRSGRRGRLRGLSGPSFGFRAERGRWDPRGTCF